MHFLWNAYKAMGGSITYLKIIKNPITSFYEGTTQPMGVTELTIEFSDRKMRDTKTVKSLFNIVDLSLTYNGIIRRLILYKIDVVTSIRRLSMKIPIEDRVITILGDRIMAQQCYQMATKPSLEAFPLASLEVDK